MKNNFTKNTYVMRQASCYRVDIYRQYRILFLCAYILGGAFTSSYGEEVLLKNGKIIVGRVSSIDADTVFLTTKMGKENILKKEIIKIQYTPFTPEQKAQALEVQRKKKVEISLEKERIREIQSAKLRKKREEELADKIRKEKEIESKATADRAAALRELVAKGQMEKPKDEPISYMDFAWRSLILPGWGHFYLERPWFGFFYAGGTIAFLGAVIKTRNEALEAQKQNHRDTEYNFILTLQPDLLSKEVRVAYSTQSNAKAFNEYQHKVDRYNGALVALATFYCVQLIHIIYNGIAWENGLLIVENQKNEPGIINTHLVAVPEFQENEKKQGVSIQGGLTVNF